MHRPTRVRRVQLLVLVVDAGGGGVKVARGALGPGGLEHVEAEHGVVEEEHRLVGLDEAHAAHVRRQVVHLLATKRPSS